MTGTSTASDWPRQHVEIPDLRRQVAAHVHVELVAIGPLRQVAPLREIGGVAVFAEGDDVEEAFALRRVGERAP
jgi:hypothetical protein